MDKTVTNSQVSVFLPTNLKHSDRQITILCSSSLFCVLKTHFIFSAKHYNGQFEILFKNAKFLDASVTVQNFKVTFEDVEFVRSEICDLNPLPGEYGEIALTFWRTSFQLSTVMVNKTFIARINFQNAKVDTSPTKIFATNLWLTVIDSVFENSSIALEVNWLCYCTLANVSFEGWIPGQSDMHSVLHMKSQKIHITMNATTIQNNLGGVAVWKPNSGLLQSWVNIRIYESYFINNTKSGSGGAIELAVHFSNEQTFSSSSIGVINSSFVENTAHRRGFLSSFGGAIYLESTTANLPIEAFQQITIAISSSIFENNNAKDGGGALYSSYGSFVLIVGNCTFIFNSVIEPGGLANGIFVLTYSTTVIEGSSFVFFLQLAQASPPLFEFLSETSVKKISLTAQCFPWYRISFTNAFGISKSSGMLVLQEASFHCTPCPLSFYMPTDGKYSISYSEMEASLQVLPLSTSVIKTNGKCSPCPVGANCPGYELKAKPNFWGYHSNSEIIFQQCPIGYCCVGNGKNLCHEFDSCSGNRDGILCGTCLKGYSLSMLSYNCIADAMCAAHWIWPLIILTAFLYTMWYTFKDFILGIPTSLSKVLCKRKACRHKQTNETHVDKGYFGILTYFVQAAAIMRLSFTQSYVRSIDSLFQKIESFLGLFLSFELSNISSDVCSKIGLTTTEKTRLKFVFAGCIPVLGNYVFASYHFPEYSMQM